MNKIPLRNKSEHFKITEEEEHRILLYMSQLGINNKSEYYRLSVLNPPRIKVTRSKVEQ